MVEVALLTEFLVRIGFRKPVSWAPEALMADPWFGTRARWKRNSQRFATYDEALAAANELVGGGSMVLKKARATPAADPVNYAWVNGQHVPLTH